MAPKLDDMAQNKSTFFPSLQMFLTKALRLTVPFSFVLFFSYTRLRPTAAH